ncbi:ATP-grasp domain-containing protein [bacterium 1XD21-13]|nr:ATP-grasp domain-containing protein [bacterium 1XD21-13]
MKKLVVIGANDFQDPLIRRAREMDFETHVFAWKDGSVGERTADFFYPISIVERERILAECEKIRPDAITSIGSDLAMLTVNEVAGRLALPCNSMECTRISTNKYAMRRAFLAAGVSVPGFRCVDGEAKTEEVEDLRLPVIVKPTDRSGSRGITKLTDWTGFSEALKLAVENSFEKRAIVEEYLTGEEYSCECISYQGTHYFLALTKKYTTGAPHFIETAHLEPSGLSLEQAERIKQAVFEALCALKVENGASHTEFMIDEENRIKIIEVGARMGGDCIGSHLVPLSTGYDYMGMVIDVACGKRPKLAAYKKEQAAYIQFVFCQEDLRLLEYVRKKSPEHVHFVSEIAPISDGKVTDSSTRFGYYILTFESPEQVKEYVEL